MPDLHVQLHCRHKGTHECRGEAYVHVLQEARTVQHMRRKLASITLPVAGVGKWRVQYMWWAVCALHMLTPVRVMMALTSPMALSLVPDLCTSCKLRTRCTICRGCYEP